MKLLQLFGLGELSVKLPETIKLAGPFLEEEYILRNKHKYLNLICKTLAKCNLVLSRDFLVLSGDNSLASRDNARIEVGLNHHFHQIELEFHNSQDYQILAIDKFVLLNPEDASTLKNYVDAHLPTFTEIKHLH